MSKNSVKLTAEERQKLLTIVREGRHDAALIQRAYILLKSDEGKTENEIADLLYVDFDSVRELQQRFTRFNLDQVLHPSDDERLNGEQPLDEADGGTIIMPPQQWSHNEDDGATVSIPLQAPEETTLHFSPEDTAPRDEGATGFLDELEYPPDEGATSFMPPSDDLDDTDETGATQFISVDTSTVDDSHGKTQLMSDPFSAEQDDDGATSYLPHIPPSEVSTVDEGATGFIPNDVDSEDEGSTKFVVDVTSSEDFGETRAIPDISSTSPAIPADTIIERGDEETDQEDDESPKHVLQLQNRYQLIKILGKGGFGAVFLAEDAKLKRRCVVKQMLTRGKSPKEIDTSRKNFEREAKLLVDLNDPGHPNIPEIYDYFYVDSGNYLVMKYIEGQNLKDALGQSDGRLPWQEAVRYAMDVSSALSYMHNHAEEPVLHRDIKPANIQLGDDGRVWLVDFGLAKADPVKGSNDDVMATQASGSFGYTPLEQWIGQAVPSSDIYALGATLHHLVTGLNPLEAFGGEFHIQKIQDLHGEFVPIRKIDRDLPEGLEAIINQAVSPDPEKRPTALQFQQKLEAVISGGQETALYTFKSGESAKTVEQLVDLCEKYHREAEDYLYSGDFERWFLLINRNDLVAAARQAVQQGENQKQGLEIFLKLILPNILQRRLQRIGWHIVRGTLQVSIVAVFVILLVLIGGSYLAGLFIQQTIANTDWPFHRLDLTEENIFDERLLKRSFNDAAGIYFDDEIQVDLISPDHLDINTTWNDIPLYIPVTLRLEDKKPHFYINQINNIPLLIIGENISQGINNGVDQAFERAPVDVSLLRVSDNAVSFAVELSGRTPFATPTPAPTPTPTPAPTPTPVDAALVVIFNELDRDVTVEIAGDVWQNTLNISGNDQAVIEVPADTYNYTVILDETGEIISQGTKTWTLKQAYRLRVGVLQ